MVALNQLLIVAGPSGVGKTTFLRSFRNGELPFEIAACRPAGR
jgi:GTPase SAR1 family protein